MTAICVAQFDCIYNDCKVIDQMVEYMTKWKQIAATNTMNATTPISTNKMAIN